MCAMFLIVHDISVTVDDIEVNAKFFHTVSSTREYPCIRLLLIGRQMAVYSRRNKSRIGKFRHIPRPRLHWRQNIRAISLNAGQPLQQPNAALTATANNVVSSAPSVPAIESPPSSVVQPTLPNNKIIQSTAVSDYNVCETVLSSCATVQQATTWLQTNRFSSFVRTFSNFSGLDLLRLTCDNLVQICGLPEGIRLYNALHKASQLTLYLCVEANPDVYHALYLAALSNQELKIKLASLIGMSCSQIDDLFLRGPNNINIIISDDVVRNFKDESTYVIELVQGHSIDCYSLLLKPNTNASPMPSK